VCSGIKFSFMATTWEPSNTVTQMYTPAIESNAFVSEVDTGDYYRGLYTDTADPVRRVSMMYRLDVVDLKALQDFRKVVRSAPFQATFNNIDPFLEGSNNTTHVVRFLKVSTPLRDSAHYYTVNVGFIK
jgi:hypothetical protein